jgi:hypothetical protein
MIQASSRVRTLSPQRDYEMISNRDRRNAFDQMAAGDRKSKTRFPNAAHPDEHSAQYHYNVAPQNRMSVLPVTAQFRP